MTNTESTEEFAHETNYIDVAHHKFMSESPDKSPVRLMAGYDSTCDTVYVVVKIENESRTVHLHHLEEAIQKLKRK